MTYELIAAALGMGILCLVHTKISRALELYHRAIRATGRLFAVLLTVAFFFGVSEWGKPYAGDVAAVLRLLTLYGPPFVFAVAVALATLYRRALRVDWTRAFWMALCELFLTSLLWPLATTLLVFGFMLSGALYDAATL